MIYLNLIPLVITFLLLPQVFVHGGLVREVWRKFLELFKSSRPRKLGPFYDNCDLCSFGPCTPMVWPSNDANFDGSAEAEKIMITMRKLDAVGKASVASILTERSAPQRSAVAEAFKKMTNTPISEKLYETLGNETPFWRYYIFIRYISFPLPEFYFTMFRVAITFQSSPNYKDQGPPMIVEILTTVPKCLLDITIELYKSKRSVNLVDELDKALTTGGKSSEYRELIKKLVEQTRDTCQHVSWFEVLKEAYKLKSAVFSGRDNEVKEMVLELFTKRSIPRIIETIVVYDNLNHGYTEFQYIFGDNYKGDEKEVYSIMARLLKNKSLYYAKAIEDILKSGILGRRYEERLTYLIVGRYDIDLKDIIAAYNQQSKTGLRADFEAWDTDRLAEAFHPIILDLIDKASRIP